MAKHNSIDLSVGSQDLSSHFYHYHRQFGGIWYIKSHNGQFLDCSEGFLSICDDENNLHLNEIYSRNNTPISCFGSRLERYEKVVCSDSKIIVLFSVMDIKGVAKPFILTLKPFFNGVYVKIEDLFFMGFERKIIHSVCSIDNAEISPEIDEFRFYKKNPFCELFEHEQIVAWLMSIGMSKREMAKYLSRSERYVVNTMNSIYTSLVVGGYDNYMILSKKYQWSKFVPPSLLIRGYLIELYLM